MLAVTFFCELAEIFVLREFVPDEDAVEVLVDGVELTGEDVFVALIGLVALVGEVELIVLLPPGKELLLFVLLVDVEVGCTTMPALTTHDPFAVSENPVRHPRHTPGHEEPISSTSVHTFGTQLAP